MAIDQTLLKNIIEATLLVQAKPINIKQLMALFDDEIERLEKEEIKGALVVLASDYEGRGIELIEVASGFRIQARQEMEPWLVKLIQEKPPRYSKALLETLVLVAYRQPITRSEIEAVRGVSVSTHIMKTLLEREWVRIVGHKEVPGRPAMYATTKEFLDYFNIKGINDLPSLSEIKDLDELATTAEVLEVEKKVQHTEVACTSIESVSPTFSELEPLSTNMPEGGAESVSKLTLSEFAEEETMISVTDLVH